MNKKLEILKEQLEDLEHSYFCYEKDCDICDGFNHKLFGNMPDNSINYDDFKINYNKIKPQKGKIYTLKINSPMPFFVLITEPGTLYSRAYRVSHFPLFKTANDVLFNELVIQPWNEMPVLNYRIKDKIFDVPDDIFKQCNDLKNKEFSKKEHLIYAYYRDVEINYQNEYFLDMDEETAIKFLEEKSSLLEKIQDKIKFLKEKAIDIMTPEPMPQFADSGDFVRFGFDKSTQIYEDDNIRINISNYTEKDEKFIRLFIDHYIGLPVTNCFLGDEDTSFEIVASDNESAVIDIPYKYFKKDSIYLNIEFEDILLGLPIKLNENQ